MSEKSLSEVDIRGLVAGRGFFPSPPHWEDEIIYFLMLDRFSDGRENVTTPAFTPADTGNAVRTDADAAAWREAGTKFVGGNLTGLESKLGYLKRLGVTVVWISPVFKQ